MNADAMESMRRHLTAAREAREAARAHPLTSARRDTLRQWQARRLAQTYADLLASPRYAAAARFFLSDLYSTTDTRERDAELERALPKMIRMLPDAALEPLGLALEADALAEALDADLAARLFTDEANTITEERYAAAYRACANRAERERQIMLVDGIGRHLDRVARLPMITTAVKLMRGPANAAGFGALQSFLERGLVAFQAMRGADEFLRIVRERETRLLQQFFADVPPPV